MDRPCLTLSQDLEDDHLLLDIHLLYSDYDFQSGHCTIIAVYQTQIENFIMPNSFQSHDGDYDQDHEQGHGHEYQDDNATSRTDHGPSISKIIPNPLTDTTTATAEGSRPEIHDHGQELVKRPEDSWNSNTLTLNSGTQVNEKEKENIMKTSTTTQAAPARQEGLDHDWEEIWEKERQAKWLEKVQEDLKGWRGGNGLVPLFSSFDLLILSHPVLPSLSLRHLEPRSRSTVVDVD